MRVFNVVLILVLLVLAGCASPNGSANGTHRGANAHADIFRIPLP